MIKTACFQSQANSPGCCYNGKYIQEGKTLQISGCESCACKLGKPICLSIGCAKPPAGCHHVQTATECCKLVCNGCTYTGIFIPEGDYRTVAPCTYAYCFGGEVAIAIADCGPYEPGCRYESTMKECCKLICDCDYNGIHIPEGENRPVAPCKFGYCNGGKVTIAIADCTRPPLGCHYEPTLKRCCNLVCDGSIDKVSMDVAPPSVA